MLVGSEPYIRDLKLLAEKHAHGRVEFHAPVPPSQIVETIATYDIGFYVLAPSSYNNRMALPNKFFDFIAAGLAVCIGPSPAMAALIEHYRFGVVAPDFEPKVVADTLNNLTIEHIQAMRDAARAATPALSAEKEMAKVVSLYERLLT
jgi:hypothetical protein